MSVIAKRPTTTTTNIADSNDAPETPKPRPAPPPQQHSALSQALTGTANLANLLPTGTLLAFQLMTPMATNNGTCDGATGPLTIIFLSILAASCFLGSFTDSFRAADGQVYYGMATRKGMWLFDPEGASGSGGGVVPDLGKYRVRVIDSIHAFLSVLVFLTVAMRDKNVVNCFYPKPEKGTQQVLDIVPMMIGVICSMLFVVFPTRRHGIGYPVTPGPAPK
ncbi:protein DMP3 [Impatiens glandulifera]|uniref:protein DMP3 n=1 Tax=Impatiens glandulifera TaxID=253017 RepID=UPI001FB059FC|nr:protein DMP3 [Impatiens glandulifera]